MAAESDSGMTMTRRQTLHATVGLGIAAGVAGTPLAASADDDDETGAEYGRFNTYASAISSGISWTVDSINVFPSDSKDSGMTESALRQKIYDDLVKRSSFNQSIFHTNREILKFIDQPAMSDAKLASFEKIQDEEQYDTVQEAGRDAIRDYYSMVQQNIISAWNEAASESNYIFQAVEDHPDIKPPYDADDGADAGELIDFINDKDEMYLNDYGEEIVEIDYTLPDGTTTTVHRIDAWGDFDGSYGPFESFTQEFSILGSNWTYDSGGQEEYEIRGFHYFSESTDRSAHTLSKWDVWQDSIWTDIDNQMDDLIADFDYWLDQVWDDIQDGELDPEELIGPNEWVELIEEDEERPNAVGHLIGLNIPGTYGDDVTIEINAYDTEMSGILAYTSDASVSVGDTIIVDDYEGNWLIAERLHSISQDWDEYDDTKGVDGGIVHFTADPSDDSLTPYVPLQQFAIHTSHGEVALVHAEDFEVIEDGETWEVDISDQLDDSIADIEEVEAIVDMDAVDEDRTNTVLDHDFEITEYEGEDDELEFEEPAEPQGDDNYIAQSEWDEMYEAMEGLIEQYEESQSSSSTSGSGFSLPFSNPFGNPLDNVENFAMYLVMGAAAFFGLQIISGN